MVGRLCAFWNGPLSGDMLLLGGDRDSIGLLTIEMLRQLWLIFVPGMCLNFAKNKMKKRQIRAVDTWRVFRQNVRNDSLKLLTFMKYPRKNSTFPHWTIFFNVYFFWRGGRVAVPKFLQPSLSPPKLVWTSTDTVQLWSSIQGPKLHSALLATCEAILGGTVSRETRGFKPERKAVFIDFYSI